MGRKKERKERERKERESVKEELEMGKRDR